MGKSSLMNKLLKRDRVIVTPYPGTTRDVVQDEIQIKGFPVRLSDTAGIQETEHVIEKEGIERSRQAAGGADLVLWVLDASQHFSEEDKKLMSALDGKPKIIVLNKCDLPRKLTLMQLKEELKENLIVECSCVTDQGVEKLEELIFRYMTHGNIEISDEAVVSRLRQKEHLESALRFISEAINDCNENVSEEFIAQYVRGALDQLGALVGDTFTEDVLEALFNQFCTGK